jgi:2-polyprenyl-6-hydroxyphenyl methylase / 3-demethylubiquinone-9 3-methyltransferase
MERTKVNNAFYDQLEEGWYDDGAHPIALLRAENAVRNPWILQTIGPSPAHILDMGCGGGLLTNQLALAGHQVTGIDLSKPSLEIGRARDTTHSVEYLHGDALEVPLPANSFDAICAMDFLEHVEQPRQIVTRVAQLLKPNGLFFFHTFNRNFLSWLLVIKGVEWFVPNTPPQMHIYSLFIKPSELTAWCQQSNLQVEQLRGLTPRPTLRGVFRRQIQKDLTFRFTRSLRTGYVGVARYRV